MKKSIISFCLLGSSTLFAAETISITVSTEDKTVAAIGYCVDGKRSGTAGKSYTGKGPKSATYAFGFRRSYLGGKDIACGTHTLKDNTHVVLINEGDKCHSIVKR